VLCKSFFKAFLKNHLEFLFARQAKQSGLHLMDELGGALA
jgi:hypothetical protein